MNMTTICIAKIEDAAGILKVRKLTWLATYLNRDYKITKRLLINMKLDSPKQLRRVKNRIKRSGDCGRYWVAKHGGKVVGFLHAARLKKKGYIASFYILPEFQGQGLGKKMFKMALRWLGRENRIWLKTAAFNSRAINFYKKFGFKSGRKCFGPLLPDGRHAPSISMVLEPN